MYLPLEAGINFSGISTLLGIVAGIVIMIVGISISQKGNKGGFRKAADSGGGVMVGIVIFAIGASFAVASGMAASLVNFFAG